MREWRRSHDALVIAVWVLVCFTIPTVMQTKLAWYINPLYPAFALGVGAAIARAFRRSSASPGKRRALAARAYLVSLGIPAERVRVVSYGKEFPFEPGHDEAAWSKNRRAHFVITAR